MSTLDNEIITKQVIEKANEYKYSLVQIFVDFTKALDSIYRDAIIAPIEQYTVE